MTLACLEKQTEYVGQVATADHSQVSLDFMNPIDLSPGQKVDLIVERDGQLETIAAELKAIDGNRCSFTLLTHARLVDDERAPRAVTAGLTVSITLNSDTIIGSLCDVSESGLRVRSLGDYEVGQNLLLQMETEMGNISFTGRVARLLQSADDECCDAGIQIMEMSRLDRARYNHFVFCLINRTRRAS